MKHPPFCRISYNFEKSEEEFNKIGLTSWLEAWARRKYKWAGHNFEFGGVEGNVTEPYCKDFMRKNRIYMRIYADNPHTE